MIKEAMKILANDGKLERIPGKGTFVSKQKLKQKLNKFFRFTRWAQKNGIIPASRILKVETLECTSHIAKHLGIKMGEPVTRIERLRLGNNEPLMLEEMWISAILCPDLHLKYLANIPLNGILTKDYNITLIRAVESIEPKIADDYVTKLLRMQKNTAFSGTYYLYR